MSNQSVTNADFVSAAKCSYFALYTSSSSHFRTLYAAATGTLIKRSECDCLQLDTNVTVKNNLAYLDLWTKVGSLYSQLNTRRTLQTRVITTAKSFAYFNYFYTTGVIRHLFELMIVKSKHRNWPLIGDMNLNLRLFGDAGMLQLNTTCSDHTEFIEHRCARRWSLTLLAVHGRQSNYRPVDHKSLKSDVISQVSWACVTPINIV